MFIEQAILSFKATGPETGCRLISATPGVSPGEVQELRAWSPGESGLVESGLDAVSVNFFRLASGVYCLSQTTPSRACRQNTELFTQCLLVPSDVLARFAYNPFAVLQAVFALGVIRDPELIAQELDRFQLPGKSSAVDQSTLGRLANQPEASWLAAMLDAFTNQAAGAVGLIGGQERPRLVAALVNCLPVECRTEISFSTGLRFSPLRPLRVFAVGNGHVEQRHLLQQQGTTLLDLTGKPPAAQSAVGWSGFVATAIAAGKIGFLAGELATARAGLSLVGLSALGDELLEKLAAEAVADQPVTIGALESIAVRREGDLPEPRSSGRRADGAHRRFASALATETITKPAADSQPDPAQTLGRQCPRVVERLELLDDTVFEAIAGRAGAFEQLTQLWPEVLAELGPDLVEESRAQYVRHALSVWRQCVEGDEIRNPALAVAAMDVVCLLFD